jgi:hypothetical protein
MTLARVYVNYESSRMYYQLFTKLFDLITQWTGQDAHWIHLHGRSFGAIVSNMDSKQITGMTIAIYISNTLYYSDTGFGRYLSDIDLEKRPWLWHIQRCVIYCTVYF